MTREPRPWSYADRTGGPLDQVLDLVQDRVPWVRVERLRVKHAADDDNVYFLGDDVDYNLVQIDTFPGGYPPFLIEGCDRITSSDIAEAVAVVVAQLTRSRT